MLFANDDSGKCIRPKFSGQRGECPCCGRMVVGRCGKIVVSHWAHSAGGECDPWSEGLTEWHLKWQTYLKREGSDIEVPITKNGQTHRADAVLESGRVVELQHSHISVAEIREREEFYGRMIWVFDAVEAFEKERLTIKYRDEGVHTFRWKHARKSISFAKQKIYLDLGKGRILWVKKMYDRPFAGYGEFIVSNRFFEHEFTLGSQKC